MGKTESPRAIQSRQDALLGLSEALTGLADRLRGRVAASRDFARLTDSAKTMAAQAWDMRTSRWKFSENAGKLANGIVSFAQLAAEASARATIEVTSNMAIVEALVSQAERISSLGHAAGSPAMDTAIRAELEPLETTLLDLRARVTTESSVSVDAENLAQRAAALVTCTLGLCGGGRQADEAATAISKALNTFVDDALSIAARMTRVSAGLSELAARMAIGAREAKIRLANRVPAAADGLLWSSGRVPARAH